MPKKKVSSNNDSRVVYNRAKWWQLLLFQVNNSATNLHFVFFLTYFLVFTTDNLGLSALIAGAMMTGARLIDAITDPIIGMWIDRTNTRFGKFRPFMLLGSAILSLSLIGMFWGVRFQSETSQYIYIGLLYVVWVIGYTLQSTCTKAAKAVLTNDPKQRSLGQGYDMVFGMLSIVGMMIIVPIMLKTHGIQSAATWRMLSIGIAMVSMIMTIIAVIAIWSKDNDRFYMVSNQRIALKQYIPMVKNNKALQGLLISASTNKLASSVVSGASAYLCIYIIGDIALQSTVSMIALPVGVLGAIVSTIVAIKTSRKTAFLSGTCLSIATLIVMLVVRPFGAGQITLYLILSGAVALFASYTETMVGGMVADVVDYEQWRSGKFLPGMVSTGFSLVDKLMSSISGLLIGGTLALCDFVANMQLTTGLFWGIIFLMYIVPLLGHIASVLGMKIYPINKEFYSKMRREIDEKTGSGEKGASGAATGMQENTNASL